MKKYIFFLVLLLLPLLSCGCNKNNDNKDKNYYDLSDYDIIEYSYFKNNNTYKYALTNILETDLTSETGLLFKIDDNKYKLLDKIVNCEESNIYKNKEYNYYYVDKENDEYKLYINRCMGGTLIEYTLKEENTIKKELNFDVSQITTSNNLFIDSIEKVEKDKIFYTAILDRKTISIECSLNNYICSEFSK